MGEADEHGNVNVSKLGKRITGSGGFIDISQNAKTMVFCGTFTNGEIVLDVEDGKIAILKDGSTKKFRGQVEQITFSGEYATRNGPAGAYVTERAVFRLEAGKMVLTEIWSGHRSAEGCPGPDGVRPRDRPTSGPWIRRSSSRSKMRESNPASSVTLPSATSDVRSTNRRT